MDSGISAASWVVGKALAPIIKDGLLEAWAASSGLGPNMDALKLELLYARGMLNNVRGREIDNPDLGQLLHMLRELAYDADDVLDEVDYFRIQDEVEGTCLAADVHPGGCVRDLALNARYTCRAAVGKLGLSLGSCGGHGAEQGGDDAQAMHGCLASGRSSWCGGHGDPPAEQGDDDAQAKHGCLPGGGSWCGGHGDPPAGQGGDDAQAKHGCLPGGGSWCGGRAISSTAPSSATNQGAHKFAARARSAASAVGKHFSCYSSTFADDEHDGSSGFRNVEETPKQKFDRVDISLKMKDILEKLRPVCAKVFAILSLELAAGSSNTNIKNIPMKRPTTNPQIKEPELYGRDTQKQSIVGRIKKDEYLAHQLTVLPIVGPGGIGKTTFTQHVYQEVKGHFLVAVWICVSLNFNANRLAQEIVKSIPKVQNETTNCSAQELIEQRLKGKRFLLVLDDMWACHADEWKNLLEPLKRGGEKGNLVIVTTRILDVAKMVQTAVDGLIELERLAPKDFMRCFQACVFGGVDESWEGHPELHDAGRKIVDKLKGFPLAAKTVGRLLSHKLTVKHWNRVLESREWELQTGDYDIMPALKVSYDYLPFNIKQCFSYCALFPEDHEFDGEQLIHFWIGLGILHSRGHNKRIEDVGMSYLEDLVNHGFFKKNQTSYGCECYVVHDLLHDLAVKVSSYECLSIYGSTVSSIQIPPSVRHLSIMVDSIDVKDKTNFVDYKNNLRALKKRLNVGNLRTLMLFGEYHGSFARVFGDLLREARRLRIILLDGASYTIEDVFCNFSTLVHLRYLRIKSMHDKNLRLPNALPRLYHLEVIDLHAWYGSFGSTRHMSNLAKLRHFLVPNYELQLHSNIFEVGKLKFIQELREFEVGNEIKGFELRQLGQLIELRGSLSICNLEKVQSKEEAIESKLTHKSHLHKLTLEWYIDRSNKNPMQEQNVLECLRPHSTLQDLCIIGHGGNTYPSWLGEELCVKELESLQLQQVSWNTFPPLEDCQQSGCITHNTFHNLKRLVLVDIEGLKRWVGTAATDLLSKLKELIIRGCPELKELPFSDPASSQQKQLANMTWSPTLQRLEIVNCPKLVLLPPVPWNCTPCSVEIQGIGSDFERVSCTDYVDGKYQLQMKGKGSSSDVTFWKVVAFNNLTGLDHLVIDDCPPLPLDHLQNLSSLSYLRVSNCRNIFYAVEGDGRIGCFDIPVERIEITRCATSGKELTQVLSYFPKLSVLTIESCEKITGLGVAEQQTMATPMPSPGSQVEQAQLGGQQQVGAREAEEIKVMSATEEGLLLLPPLLQQLFINKCPNLLFSDSSRFPFPTSLKILSLWNLEGAEMLLPLSNLTSLTELRVYNCVNLKGEGLWLLFAHGYLTTLDVLGTLRFFDGTEPQPPFSSELKRLTHDTACFLHVPICKLFSSSLTNLEFSDGKLVRFTSDQEEALQHLVSLQELYFSDGYKMQALPAGLQRLPNLKKFHIDSCSALQTLPMDGLPSSLQELDIFRCGAMLSLPKDGLPTSLQKLTIYGCEAMSTLPKDSLPSSLQELTISNCQAMISLPKDSLPSSLQELTISSCQAMNSLPKAGLPSSLQKLTIEDCPALRSLPKVGLPSSLQKLTIEDCPALRSLPKVGLPSSLLELDVRRSQSEELRRQCRKLVGTIPIIRL